MPRYRVKVGDKILGPHSEEALTEMASVRVFKPDALIAPELTEEWKAVQDIPELHAKFFPPKRPIQLKARTFETVETAQQEGDGPVTVDQILKDNLAAEANRPHKPLRRVPNRRRRDFLFSFVMINGVIAGLWYYLPRTRETDVAFGSAAALISVAIYWLFYQIMDRY